LPFGTPLAEDNIEEIPWSAKSLPAGAFSSKQALFKDGRRITLATIQQNEPILTSKVTGPGERASLSSLLDKDMRAITVRVDDVRGVAGFILPNDRVDVVLIRSSNEVGAGRKDYSDLLLQDVKVIGVDQIVSEQKDRPTVAKAVTLEVTPFQAQKISLATNVGHLSLILRKAGDPGVVADHRVTEADLSSGEAARLAPPAPVAKNEPVPAKSEPVFTDTGAMVTIIRNLKSQDYKVVRDAR
jgi:pilus assembly protein CpaB